MLSVFLSRFRIRRSRTAILWISSAEKRSEEKFSIGPTLLTKDWREPTFGTLLLNSLVLSSD
jgi:hypothetical protein